MLWKDTDYVLKHYIASMLNIEKTFEWYEIAQKLTSELWKHYYPPYLKHILKSKRLGFISNDFFLLLMAKIVKMKLNYQYIKKYKNIFNVKFPDYGTAIIVLLILVFFAKKDMKIRGTIKKIYDMHAKSWKGYIDSYIRIYRSYYWQKII